MKPFINIRITDRISVGLTPEKEEKKDSNIGCGCLSAFLVLCIICIPISLISSCVNGEEETTTEPTTVYSEESSVPKDSSLRSE